MNKDTRTKGIKKGKIESPKGEAKLPLSYWIVTLPGARLAGATPVLVKKATTSVPLVIFACSWVSLFFSWAVTVSSVTVRVETLPALRSLLIWEIATVLTLVFWL